MIPWKRLGLKPSAAGVASRWMEFEFSRSNNSGMLLTAGLAPNPGAISTIDVTSRDETKPPAPASNRNVTPTPRIWVRSPPPAWLDELPQDPKPPLPGLPVPAPWVIQIPAVVLHPGTGLHRSQSATPSREWSIWPEGAEPVISKRPPANSYMPWFITM